MKIISNLKTKTIKIVLIGFVFFLLLAIFFPVKDFAINEYKLKLFKKEVSAYIHPDFSKKIQTIAIVSNTASSSNRCDLIVAEIYESAMSQTDLQNAHDSVFQKHKENKNINTQLFFLNKKSDVAILQNTFSDIYEKISMLTKENSNAYVLITTREILLNNDIRCH
ncbi:MAG: hypothetical protein Q7K54_02055 [Candidatus Parcubacteria bacterium]|nr:hypothetical protein [Candidatus Parcubacteria bacterium]